MYIRQFCEKFFLETEDFPKEFVDKIKKVILCLNVPILKFVSFMR